MDTDTVEMAKEVVRVTRQILKVEAILVKLGERQAELLRELSGT